MGVNTVSLHIYYIDKLIVNFNINEAPKILDIVLLKYLVNFTSVIKRDFYKRYFRSSIYKNL